MRRRKKREKPRIGKTNLAMRRSTIERILRTYLPADGSSRLLKVNAHNNQQLISELIGENLKPSGCASWHVDSKRELTNEEEYHSRKLLRGRVWNRDQQRPTADHQRPMKRVPKEATLGSTEKVAAPSIFSECLYVLSRRLSMPQEL
jgi:hypothetical protein